MGALTYEEITDRLGPHVGTDAPGLTWLIRTGGDVLSGALGSRDRAGEQPLTTEEIFRISSMTKPVTAVGALILVADGVLDLDDPIESRLPELADRQVLRAPGADLDDTVPAERSATVRDLLTNTLGWGMDFTDFSATPLSRRWAELGLGDGP
ncbi:MAG TPA: beta-lactamase family protein, partial [Candidatus Ruania gallistercoris]|nr:beta-lactamase family protein [Candidatus Ruania gallistercoris]